MRVITPAGAELLRRRLSTIENRAGHACRLLSGSERNPEQTKALEHMRAVIDEARAALQDVGVRSPTERVPAD